MGDMTGPVTKTTPPQVQMENVVCSATYHDNHELTLANGTKLTSNFLQVSASTPIFGFEQMTDKSKLIWHDFGGGSKAYYLYSEQAGGLVEAPFMTNSFNLGDKAVTFSISRGDVPYVGHKMGVIGSDSKNLIVDGTLTKRVYVCTVDETIGVRDENGNYIHNAVNDIWYQTDKEVVKAKVNSLSYSDNPTTGAIDLSQTIQKPGFQLSIFPNPVLDSATISFVLPRDDAVSVLVYNALGQRVSSPLLQQNLPAGKQQVALDTNEFPAGMYFARIEGQSGDPQVVTLVVAR